MPFKPKVPCRHPGCNELIPAGHKYCEKHRAMHPEEVRSADGRGYNRAWQKASKAFLQKHPLCVVCMKEGRYIKATDVDHIIPHRDDDQFRQGRVHFFCSDVYVHNRKDLFSKLLDKLTKLEVFL